MAYDPRTRQLVLFSGGTGGGGPQAPDTWLWNGRTWTRARPPASPPAREGAVMAYNAEARQLILFGGVTGTSSGLLSDTWIWNGRTWRQLHPAARPPARYDATMAYDPAAGRLVLFGGYGGQNNTGNLNDTWTWNGTTWHKSTPGRKPPARANGSLAYDPHHHAIVLFGGSPAPTAHSGPPGNFLSDTWIFRKNTWTKLSPAARPPGRANAILAYDQATQQDILFGGIGRNGASRNDTWAWNGRAWTKIITTRAPSPRSPGALAYDAATRQVVMFGGWEGFGPDDTWNLRHR